MNQDPNTRDQLLSLLKGERGNWVSGESLSNRFGVSRSAVWKHVSALRGEGYGIESSPKKGYRLLETPDLLLPREILEGLDRTLFGKGEILHFIEIDSTNRAAKELALRGAPEGTVVLAETQTAGRGRMGRSWFSPFGEGIYMSLVLRPPISPAEAPGITLLSAVAAAEALLASTPLEVSIKWPNDILVGGRKLAGILTEITTEMDAVNSMIVGLGLNVNTSSFPEDPGERATSIMLETGRPFSRVSIAREYLRRFETHYAHCRTEGFDSIMERWRALEGTLGRRVRVDTIGRTYMGTAVDINENGFLIIEDDKEGYRRLFSGDVTLI